jgi:cbb3-type cytochrome oxidase subunit 3
VLLIVALLKQLIVAVGLLVAIIKLAIVVVFIAVFVMIAYAIYRDHKKHKAEV